jgi:hypothetical protein
MSHLIAVRPNLSLLWANFKRDLLIFTKVGVIELNKFRPPNFDYNREEEIQWLLNKRLLFNVPAQHDKSLLANPDYRQCWDNMNLTFTNVLSAFNSSYKYKLDELHKRLADLKNLKHSLQSLEYLKGTDQFIKELEQIFAEFKAIENNNKSDDQSARQLAFRELVKFDELVARQASIKLRLQERVSAFPILSSDLNLPSSIQNRKASILKIIINALPVPSDDVPWEQVMEFRSTEQNRTTFLELRDWITNVAHGSLSAREIEEKLEHLLSQYRHYMTIHRLKYSSGILETLVVTSAEIIEDLTQLRFSKLAQTMFGFRKRKVELLEAELTAPGKEIAFIWKARDKFTRNPPK